MFNRWICVQLWLCEFRGAASSLTEAAIASLIVASGTGKREQPGRGTGALSSTFDDGG